MAPAGGGHSEGCHDLLVPGCQTKKLLVMVTGRCRWTMFASEAWNLFGAHLVRSRHAQMLQGLRHSAAGDPRPPVEEPGAYGVPVTRNCHLWSVAKDNQIKPSTQTKVASRTKIRSRKVFTAENGVMKNSELVGVMKWADIHR